MNSFKMDVNIIGEHGYKQALFGLGLSYGLTTGMKFEDFKNNKELVEKLNGVAVKLSTKDGGHNKFLESIRIWLDVNAPIYWWVEADTYRLTSKQSESTMHTLVKEIEGITKNLADITDHRHLDHMLYQEHQYVQKYVLGHFDVEEHDETLLGYIRNQLITIAQRLKYITDPSEKIIICKRFLPTSYMQRREWLIDYKTFRNMVLQRYNHRLPHWHKFIDDVYDGLKHPELVTKEITAFGGIAVNKINKEK